MTCEDGAMADGVKEGSLRRHLLFPVTGKAANDLQTLRVRWDPVMADRTPPHISLVYPEEVDDDGLLLSRVEQAVALSSLCFG